jgi:hypothetical protein
MFCPQMIVKIFVTKAFLSKLYFLFFINFKFNLRSNILFLFLRQWEKVWCNAERFCLVHNSSQFFYSTCIPILLLLQKKKINFIYQYLFAHFICICKILAIYKNYCLWL